MIIDNTPLSMAESVGYIKKSEDPKAGPLSFIKKFVKLSPKEAKELKGKLEKLDLMKISAEHIVKIIDLMPESEIDLNKIFNDVGLDEDETKKILETVKEFK